jgi:hypothetical protein
MSTVPQESAARLGRRGLLGLGAGLLFVGWGGTALFARVPGLAVIDPRAATVALWLALFGLIAAVALVACPEEVTFSRPILVWVGLNGLGFLLTGTALVGLVPGWLSPYAYWHVWVAGAVVGFLATGTLLRRAGSPAGRYYVAAVVELWILTVGLVAFETLVPGLYLVLAVVHPTPLALDALDLDATAWSQTVAQVAVYTVALLAVILT